MEDKKKKGNNFMLPKELCIETRLCTLEVLSGPFTQEANFMKMRREHRFRLNMSVLGLLTSAPWRRADADVGIGCFQTGLLLLYRGECKFNYLFVHVSSLQAGLHNLNGNRGPIYCCSSVILVPSEVAPHQHISITSWGARRNDYV